MATASDARSLSVEHVPIGRLRPPVAAEVHALCDDAYRTPTAEMFRQLGAGDHLLGRVDGVLASHLMWVTRWLQPAGQVPLRTAYVEMVATAPTAERRGYASALLRRLVTLVPDYDLAALCPASDDVYRRLGWRFWEGPLFARRAARMEHTPDERVMILALPRTPPLDLLVPLSVEWRAGEVW